MSRQQRLTLMLVKKLQKGWMFWPPAPFIGGGERERGGRPLESASHVSVEPDR
jgi:hypothetical protein